MWWIVSGSGSIVEIQAGGLLVAHRAADEDQVVALVVRLDAVLAVVEDLERGAVGVDRVGGQDRRLVEQRGHRRQPWEFIRRTVTGASWSVACRTSRTPGTATSVRDDARQVGRLGDPLLDLVGRGKLADEPLGDIDLAQLL